MSWTSILVLAAGAYLFKALGLVVFGPLMARGSDSEDEINNPSPLLRVGQLLPPALLSALVVSQTVADGTELTIDARLAGVAAGAVAVWRKAPFWLVLIIAAAVTAGIRLAAG